MALPVSPHATLRFKFGQVFTLFVFWPSCLFVLYYTLRNRKMEVCGYTSFLNEHSQNVTDHTPIHSRQGYEPAEWRWVLPVLDPTIGWESVYYHQVAGWFQFKEDEEEDQDWAAVGLTFMDPAVFVDPLILCSTTEEFPLKLAVWRDRNSAVLRWRWRCGPRLQSADRLSEKLLVCLSVVVFCMTRKTAMVSRSDYNIFTKQKAVMQAAWLQPAFSPAIK